MAKSILSWFISIFNKNKKMKKTGKQTLHSSLITFFLKNQVFHGGMGEYKKKQSLWCILQENVLVHAMHLLRICASSSSFIAIAIAVAITVQYKRQSIPLNSQLAVHYIVNRRSNDQTAESHRERERNKKFLFLLSKKRKYLYYSPLQPISCFVKHKNCV